MTNETIVLDPPEFVQFPARDPLGLDELGIRIIDAKWGDAEHELFLVKQERGEIPADRHPPNRTVEIKLKAEEDGDMPLAKAAQLIQQKVGRMQEEGGWVKRILDAGGGYETNVGMIVLTAVLGGLHGWQMAHRKIANEIILTLTVGPYCYGTKEEETAVFVEEVNHQLIYTVPNYLGTAPGIKRVIVKNIGGVNWLGLAAAWESRDFQEGETAEPHYQGNALTALGSTVYSSPYVFRIVKNVSNWLAYVDSKLKGPGKHMTHVGGRRIFVRVEGGEGMELRLEWKALGSPYWTANESVKIPGPGTHIMELGVAKPEAATLGEQQWEWRIAVRKGTSTVETLLTYDVWLFPVEQFIKMEFQPRYITPSVYDAEDEFVSTKEEAIGGKTMSDGVSKWVTGGETVDFEYNPFVPPLSTTIRRKKNNNSAVRWARPEKPLAGYHIVACQCDLTFATDTGKRPTPKELTGFYGAGIGLINAANELRFMGKSLTIVLNEAHQVVSEQDLTRFFNVLYPSVLGYGPWYTLTFIAVGGQYVVGWIQPRESKAPLGIPMFTSNMDLNNFWPCTWDLVQNYETGTLEVHIFRSWDNFKVWVPDLDAIAFANRKLEMRSDGVFRQGEIEDVWAKIIADGFLPTAAPSGMEQRPTRGLIVPNQGNFESMAENSAGINKLEVVEKYFPGYHFTSEAE